MNRLFSYFYNMKTIKSWSPGRINLIGEHIDYNDGYVMPAAIDKGTQFEITINGSDNMVDIHAQNIDDSVKFKIGEAHGLPMWAKYLYGVLMELRKYGADIGGFSATFSGDVPIGSGLSSSASLECSFAYGLDKLWDLHLDDWQIIKACQKAEHNYVGIKCGIMDQFASIKGRSGNVMRLDCRDLSYQYLPCNLGSYQLVLLNTHVSHELATSAYNDRRTQCESALNKIQDKYENIKSYRDFDLNFLESTQNILSDIEMHRARHVITEIQRVLTASDALLAQDMVTLGKLMYGSHESLSHDYEVSCSELDALVHYTRQDDKVLGSRMMGGGFGGCTINLVHEEHIETFINRIKQQYYNAYGIELTAYQLNISDGAQIII